MPYVAGKKFPYTKKGKAEAAEFTKKRKKTGFLERLSKGQRNIRKELRY